MSFNLGRESVDQVKSRTKLRSCGWDNAHRRLSSVYSPRPSDSTRRHYLFPPEIALQSDWRVNRYVHVQKSPPAPFNVNSRITSLPLASSDAFVDPSGSTPKTARVEIAIVRWRIGVDRNGSALEVDFEGRYDDRVI